MASDWTLVIIHHLTDFAVRDLFDDFRVHHYLLQLPLLERLLTISVHQCPSVVEFISFPKCQESEKVVRLRRGKT
jgi:hypothetical protein